MLGAILDRPVKSASCQLASKFGNFEDFNYALCVSRAHWKGVARGVRSLATRFSVCLAVATSASYPGTGVQRVLLA